jgi:homoserine O-succinyltransferase
MPVKITNQLSAVENRQKEGIIAITEQRAVT